MSGHNTAMESRRSGSPCQKRTHAVTSLIVKICIEHRSDLAQDTAAAVLSVKVNSRVDPQRFEPSRNELGKVKSPTMEFNRLHLHPA